VPLDRVPDLISQLVRLRTVVNQLLAEDRG
jgi:hypothetical protein